MDTVFKFLFEFLGQFFGSLWSIITGLFTGIGEAFNFPAYINIINGYTTELGGLAWGIAILAIVLLVAVLGLIVWLIIVAVKKFIRSHRRRKDTDSLVKEVQALNKEVMRLNLEKDKILSMKVSQIGLNPNEIAELTGEEIEALNNGEEEENTNETRFYKLAEIDELWADYVPPVYDNEITLPEFCDRFRMFACSRLGLYYDIKLIRLFVASFASTRLIILQGISGTGKTSLAYAFGKFINNPSIIASVQPSWRDRTELFGYFNEFTKKFNETELLRAMYEASYNENIYAVILDEMNIARVEYYFAEMLSILEMPSRDEWVVDIIPNAWPTDPKHIKNGQLKIPPNMWYIGTANNDDSTFAITDKVYDRAMPINIDTKGVAFDAEDTPPINISYKHFEDILNEAKAKYVVSEENIKKIGLLDDYVIEHFRIAFGNRIVKQLRDFVPAYVGTGGTEIDGLDYVLARKVFRKFESLNLSYIRDEIDGLCAYIDELFGEENMNECKDYLRMLKKLV
ncbi:AAA family ATPase [uncultured Ruminococcus sp.]|uniref:AAA family ATPase n=1 Tax=uncultured Ruminococcus sp. TaxID=165186 RepID=UPI0025DE03C3|nr:AAA family ATPase [uncultured Ruminococcus sp.]